ncbi:unnamed protein product [Fusarium equiseti]|uniref:Uncharacterized protein n=1 Tax=Fusarium equiseti TaxID=61235 RepID=A0A8J2INM0_FUSEQ|nr:unnamed protein product [Fusarium equiseti]
MNLNHRLEFDREESQDSYFPPGPNEFVQNDSDSEYESDGDQSAESDCEYESDEDKTLVEEKLRRTPASGDPSEEPQQSELPMQLLQKFQEALDDHRQGIKRDFQQALEEKDRDFKQALDDLARDTHLAQELRNAQYRLLQESVESGIDAIIAGMKGLQHLFRRILDGWRHASSS